MEKLENIISTYQQIIQESEQALQRARKRIYYISLLRLVLFVEAIAAAFIFWSDGWLSLLVFAILPFISFIWLVKRHNLWFYRKDYLKKKIEINEQELRAIQYDFSDFDSGNEYIDPAHLYTYDLDVFGDYSLFQYINRTSTPVGKQHLADWFNAHLELKESIEQRQEAIRELSTDLEYRQQIRLFGLLYKGKPADTNEIREWAGSPSYYRKHTLLRIIPTVVSIINLICIGSAIVGILPATVPGGVFFVSSFSVLSFLKVSQNCKQLTAKIANPLYLRRPNSSHREKGNEQPCSATAQNGTYKPESNSFSGSPPTIETDERARSTQ